MQTGKREWKRRTTSAALKQQLAAWLTAALPSGWVCQVLPAAGAGRAAVADILVISPRGACHFLFVRAPADRWWDGGPRTVDAERFSPADASLARRLRAAGHRARAVWSQKDLWRALNAWGCPARQTTAGGAALDGGRGPKERPGRLSGPAPRSVLRLNAWRGRADV